MIKLQMHKHDTFVYSFRTLKVLKLILFLFCYRMEEAFNPWNVQSLEAFHVYCCPECDSKHMTKSDFIGHAMFQHPRARQFVPAIIQNTTPNVPQPPQQQLENRNNYPLVQNFKQEFPQARTTVNLPITNNFSCDLSYMTPVVTIHQIYACLLCFPSLLLA